MDEQSADHVAMTPYWTDVRNVLGGIKAMRAAGEKYLPKFVNEKETAYARRVVLTKMTNVFAESASSLAAKPFQEPIKFNNTVIPPEIDTLQWNIDGRGNNQTVFAAQLFHQAMVNGIHWVLVDFPDTSEAVISVAEAKARGIRPYWVHVAAPNVLEVQSQMIDGVEVLTLFRILEAPDQVRVYKRSGDEATWEVWKKDEQLSAKQNQPVWTLIRSGNIGVGRIPLIPFITGMREGETWVITPSLRDAVDLQIELYLAESGVKHLKNVASYPMLNASGVKPNKDASGNILPIEVGPMTALYGEPDGMGNAGSWAFIEPSGESLRFLTQDAGEMKSELRELMRQPLTVNSENLTVITTAVAAGKTKTLVGAWRLLLVDMLEEAWLLTAKWMSITFEPDVFVFKDFDEFLESKDLAELTAVRARGDISRATYWRELVRRGLLSSDFNADNEVKLLLEEVPVDPLTNGENDALEN